MAFSRRLDSGAPAKKKAREKKRGKIGESVQGAKSCSGIADVPLIDWLEL